MVQTESEKRKMAEAIKNMSGDISDVTINSITEVTLRRDPSSIFLVNFDFTIPATNTATIVSTIISGVENGALATSITAVFIGYHCSPNPRHLSVAQSVVIFGSLTTHASSTASASVSVQPTQVQSRTEYPNSSPTHIHMCQPFTQTHDIYTLT